MTTAANEVTATTPVPREGALVSFLPYREDPPELWRLGDGTTVTIRGIRRGDTTRIERFHRSLPDSEVRHRHFGEETLGHEKSHTESLHYLTLLALRRDHKGQEEIIGMGSLSDLPGGGTTRFAVAVADRYHSQGLGTELLQRLVRAAHAAQRPELIADIAPENHAMQCVCLKTGCGLRFDPEAQVVRACLPLASPPMDPAEHLAGTMS